MVKIYFNPQTYTVINGLGSMIHCFGWVHQLDVPNSRLFNHCRLFHLVNQLMTHIVKQKCICCEGKDFVLLLYYLKELKCQVSQ